MIDEKMSQVIVEADRKRLEQENERLRKTVDTALAWLEAGFDDPNWYGWFEEAIAAVKTARGPEPCPHEHLDAEGCCWRCGADCRGIPTK
jgi:hypothetical protein